MYSIAHTGTREAVHSLGDSIEPISHVYAKAMLHKNGVNGNHARGSDESALRIFAKGFDEGKVRRGLQYEGAEIPVPHRCPRNSNLFDLVMGMIKSRIIPHWLAARQE